MRDCSRRMRVVIAVGVLSALLAHSPCEACGPGPHWVDTCPAGVDLIHDHYAVVGIDTDLDCVEDASLTLLPCPENGAVTITRSDPMDDSIHFPGLRPLDGHLDVIDTEIVQMCLVGGGFTLTAGAGLGHGGVLGPSYGAIAELADTPPTYPAESFFDVMFEIETPTGLRLYNQSPMRLEAVIYGIPPDDAQYVFPPECTPLFSSPTPGTGEHLANLTSAVHRVNPAGAPVEDTTWGVVKALFH